MKVNYRKSNPRGSKGFLRVKKCNQKKECKPSRPREPRMEEIKTEEIALPSISPTTLAPAG